MAHDEGFFHVYSNKAGVERDSKLIQLASIEWQSYLQGPILLTMVL